MATSTQLWALLSPRFLLFLPFSSHPPLSVYSAAADSSAAKAVGLGIQTPWLPWTKVRSASLQFSCPLSENSLTFSCFLSTFLSHSLSLHPVSNLSLLCSPISLIRNHARTSSQILVLPLIFPPPSLDLVVASLLCSSPMPLNRSNHNLVLIFPGRREKKRPSTVEDYLVLDTIGTGTFGICRRVQRRSDGAVRVRLAATEARMKQAETESRASRQRQRRRDRGGEIETEI